MSSAGSSALNRFGLGARAGDALPAKPRAHLLAQLERFEPRPPAIASAPASPAMATQFRTYLNRIRPFLAANGLGPATQGSARPTDPKINEAAIRAELRRQFRENYGAQVRARLTQALITDTPFPERLVHFWANHFAVSADKLQTIGLAGTLEFEAIRPRITGRFEDMLLAVERHPAMQLYLDQAQSIGPDSPLAQAAARRRARRGGANRRQPGLNENLAREILELHTLGAGSGYTQADVQELARGLTGWSIGGFVRRPIGLPAPDGAFIFQPSWHQPGARQLLGTRFAQSGEAQGEAMLVMLARHPATARHICTKLARHFVSDTPAPALINRMVTAWTASNGDLARVYRTLIEAPEAWAPDAAKFKTPWDWLVSGLRGLGITRPDLRTVMALNALGQPVWRPGSPAGWDDVTTSWAAPDALMRRVEIADRLGQMAGRQLDARSLAPSLLPGTLRPATATALARAESGQQALALMLVAPEFLWRA